MYLTEKAERLRVANLCLCVSQALCSWIPAWISCYFSHLVILVLILVLNS